MEAGGAAAAVVMGGLAGARRNIVWPEEAGGVMATAVVEVMVAVAVSATVAVKLGIWRGIVTRAEVGVGDSAAVVEVEVEVEATVEAGAVVVVVIIVERMGIWPGNALMIRNEKWVRCVKLKAATLIWYIDFCGLLLVFECLIGDCSLQGSCSMISCW